MAVEKILLQFEADIKDLKSELSEVKSSIKGVEKEAQTTGSKLTSAFKGVGVAIAAAFSVQQVSQFISKSIQLAAEAEGVRKAFDRLNDPNLLRNLREATNGTVSDLELMKSAVKASNFKLPLEQLAGYFKFAAQRARDTGESVDYLVESIVLGISRKSIPILDNLGISATEVQTEFKKTGDFAEAVGNIISRSMGEADGATTGFADTIAQTRANIENLQVQIGDGLAPAFEKLLGLLNQGIEFTKSFGLVARLLNGSLDEFVDLRGRGNSTSIETKKTTEDLTEAVKEQTTAIKQQAKAITERDGIEPALENWEFWLNKILKGYEDLGHATGDLILNNLSSQADLFNEINFLGLSQDTVISNLTARYNEGLLTQEQYNDLIRDRIELLGQETQASLDEADALALLGQGFGNLATGLGALGKENERFMQFQLFATTAQILFSQAASLANALKTASTSSPDAITFFVQLSSMVAAITAFTGQALGIANSANVPQYAEGVVDLRGAGTETSDSIHARLSRGESVITAKATRQDKGLFEAANNLQLERYINENYVLPALMKKKKEESAMFDDYRLYLTMMKGQKQDRDLNKKLIDALGKRQNRHNVWA